MRSPTTIIAAFAVLFVLAGVGLALFSEKKSAVSSPETSPVVMDTAAIPPPPPTTPESDTEGTSTTPITVNSPLPHTRITSPLVVSGNAPGTWFFEGSFPIVLNDATGNTIARGLASSTENWMTEDMIPFSAVLEWTSATGTEGTLVLKKDNPSGDPSHDETTEVPVSF